MSDAMPATVGCHELALSLFPVRGNFAGSPGIGAHPIRGLDAETTPFCFVHLSPGDLAEDARDGDFDTR